MNKKNLLFIPILFLCVNSFSQKISGRIQDLKTNKPVPYATIYLEGTTIGTVSNINGDFNLNLKNHESIPIIVSVIGYKSKRFTNYDLNSHFVVQLDPAEYTLVETEIKAKRITRAARARYTAEFKREFLGISRNAYRCEILNEKDLKYDYDKSTKTLIANSKKPLIIKNNALGYEITYYLDHFISTEKDIYYDGYYFFKEIQAQSLIEAKRINDNRFNTYLGSRLALIRSIYNDDLEKNMFKLYDTSYSEIKLNEILDSLPSGDKRICLGQELTIHFGYLEFPHKSKLIPIDSCIQITKEGYFNAKSIKWTNRIALKRVADLLPFEYKLSEEQKAFFN